MRTDSNHRQASSSQHQPINDTGGPNDDAVIRCAKCGNYLTGAQDQSACVPHAPQASTEPVHTYAYEYGKSNGDGSYSVVIERGDIVKVRENVYEYGPPQTAVKDWPVKHLYLAAPQAAIDLREESARLNFVLAKTAWIQWATHDDTFKRCQLWTQDDDENYIILSGEGKSFATEREAIDAAIAVAKIQAMPD